MHFERAVLFDCIFIFEILFHFIFEMRAVKHVHVCPHQLMFDTCFMVLIKRLEM